MSEIFRPGNIGSLSLKNRVIRSATEEMHASREGRVTDEYVRLYTRLARGGVGLIITGNYGVSVLGRGSPHTVLVDSDEALSGLEKLVQAVHREGSKIIAQLNHVGRQRHPETDNLKPAAPSPVRVKLTRVMPRPLSSDEIEDTIADFAKAARRMKEAGFDGVQFHGAHGYLINQFLSSFTNRRTDKWGGSPENRSRFLAEVFKAVRGAVGPGYPVLVKVAARDRAKGGITLDDCIATCKMLKELGADAVEVSDGMDQPFGGDIPFDIAMRGRSFVEKVLFKLLLERSLKKDAYFVEGYHLADADAVRKEVGIPVIAVGGIRRRATMEHALKEGRADFISMSRPFIRQPNLVNLLEKGEPDPVSCITCNRCVFEMLVHLQPLRCQNPLTPHPAKIPNPKF